MPSKSKIMPADTATALAYNTAKSKSFGNLHERMKWLIGCKEELREHLKSEPENRTKELFQAIEIAVMDLETEVSYTKPAKPPFARRPNDSQNQLGYKRRRNN